MLAITFPAIDPVLVWIGPVPIHWYALAYVAGLVLGTWYGRWMAKHPPALMTPSQVDDFLLWAMVGIIAGGRLGYVLFYEPGKYLSDPLRIINIGEGGIRGMSFHGGILGVSLAVILYARSIKVTFWYVADYVSTVAPIGLGLGRLGNFINGELWGRVAPDVPWAMVFPGAGPEPRHPSQLYQFALEGVLLLVVMHILWRCRDIRSRPGILTGAFWIGYGVVRIIGEHFREPDAFLGFLIAGATMGQLLSLPMILFGIYAIWRAQRAPAAA